MANRGVNLTKKSPNAAWMAVLSRPGVRQWTYSTRVMAQFHWVPPSLGMLFSEAISGAW